MGSLGWPELIILLFLAASVIILYAIIRAATRPSRKAQKPPPTQADPNFKCPKCGGEIKYGAKYCENCGEELSWKAQVKGS